MTSAAPQPTTAGVAVVGDVLVDVLAGADGRTTRRPGGAGLNLALSVRRLGLPSTLAAPVAADADGTWLSEVASSGGVGLIRLPHPGATGVATSWRVDGEPRYEFSPSVHSRLYQWDDVSADAVSSSGNVLVVNSFPMHDQAQAVALADLATRTGQVFVVDPNVRPALVADVAEYRDGFRILAAVADVVKLSEQDVLELGLDDPDALVRELFEDGVRVVLLTRGPGGASVIVADGERVDVPVAELPGPVVDTMGAGDATLAVLAAGIARSGTTLGTAQWAELAAEAMDVAAAVCRVPGGTLVGT